MHPTLEPLCRRDLPSGLPDVALAFAAGAEACGLFVDGLYDLLGRLPSPAERGGWLAALDAGTTREAATAAVLASEEFGRGNRTDPVWLASVYLDLFGRFPDPDGERFWLDALPHAGRDAVALALAASDEAEGSFIRDAYSRYLHRPAAAEEVAPWVAGLRAGLTREAAVTAFLASPEYVALHGGPVGAVKAYYPDALGRLPDSAGLGYWLTTLGGGVARVNDPDPPGRRQNTQSETAVVALPGGGYVVAFNDSSGIAVGMTTSVYWSADGSAWHRAALPDQPLGNGGDPELAVAGVTVYLAGLSTTTNSAGPLYASVDGGRTWAFRGDYTGDSGQGYTVDKDALAAGPRGELYALWTSFPNDDPPSGVVVHGIAAAESIDGGRTWTGPVAVAIPSQSGFDLQFAAPDVGDDGRLSVAYIRDGSHGGRPGIYARTALSPGGLEFGPEVLAAPLASTRDNADLGLPWRSSAAPTLKHAGTVEYLSYADLGGVFLRKSADGVRWSAPLDVSGLTPGRRPAAFQPALDVTTGGVPGLAWYEWGADLFLTYHAWTGAGGGTAFEVPVAPWFPAVARDGSVAGDYMGDYDGAAGGLFAFSAAPAGDPDIFAFRLVDF